ncbi:DUF3472 domain-containing protein [Brevifollis gellanilyticus]|uniref:Uncharacterized protein n=1 Tax=Brevifollis gellanilyticus TaxID=748831 RepID=A0A512M503_9BACT|nr:DUF3472 domain-containing protein [Brevifollis gellanilyticus]GEP41808.1 hypothetical protein BGE01nite_10990 [Brevifollis gellanilyticus]
MRIIHTLIALLGFTTTFVRGAEPTAACSIHFQWPAPASTWFYNEATVQASTPGSYFSICGWNTGYFGIQELSNGSKVAIFSVWDPAKGDNPENVPLEQRVEVLHEGKDVKVSRFGGEGTGGKSMTPFDWKIGEKVRCIVQATVEGEKTAYSGWLYQPAQREWKHLVTFRVKTGGKPLSGLYSFVEDFRRDTKSVNEERRCDFGNGWVRTVEGKMVPISEGRFTCSKAANEAQDRINAGRTPTALFLANGGSVRTEVKVGTMLKQLAVAPVVPHDLPLELLK